VAARIKELAKPIEELRSKVIAKTEAPIDGSRETCRAKECEMGSLVADAMLDRVKGQGVTVAITNGGGLRASIDGGDVTMGEVITVLPFQNTLSTFQLKGSDIRAALENGLSQVEEGGGRFPQVAGLKYSFDRSKPAGSRLVSVEVKEGDAFAALDPEKTYSLVSNNFMRGGGDGYAVFKDKGENAYDYGPGLETVLADYLAAHQPFKPYTDGRITEVAAAAPEAAPSAAPEPDAAAPEPEAAAPEPQAAAKPAESEAATTALEASPPAAAAAEGPRKHVIARGDTLWDLADSFYGSGTEWRKISAANGDPAPRALEIGRELDIPAE
jgi:5'-nucleotidase